MKIRDMQQQDLPAVYEIETQSYEHPWSHSLLSKAQLSNKYTVVLEIQQKIIGYAIVSYIVGEAELLNICIHPNSQGKGLATLLLNHIIEHAKNSGNSDMYLEVRASNHAAITLYQHAGFNEIGVRKGYYPDKEGREDAILMALPLVV